LRAERRIGGGTVERKEKEELLARMDKSISDLKKIRETIDRSIESLGSSVKRLRYQQTLPIEEQQ